MRRLDRGTLRSAAFVLLLLCVFLTVNTSVAYGATSSSGGGLLSPLELSTSEGVSLKGYTLGSQPDSAFSLPAAVQGMVMSGLFTVVQVLVGLACWAIEVAYRFPLLKILTEPAQHLSDVYTDIVVDDLGLKALLLTLAFAFGLLLLVRGKAAKGLGEIALTLVIGALAASVFVTPNFLLGKDGPLRQAQSAATEVAQKTVSSYSWGGNLASDDPCKGMSGQALTKCFGLQDATTPDSEKIAKPIQDAVTNATVVKPYMLLQYGRILDPGKSSDRKAYAAHLKWVTGGYAPKPVGDGTCASVADEAKEYCAEHGQKKTAEEFCKEVRGRANAYCKRNYGESGVPGMDEDELPKMTAGDALLDLSTRPITSSEDQQFAAFLKDLKKAGPVGKSAAAYAAEPSWWRVSAVLLVFIAALLICALLLSASLVLLAIPGVCSGAAAAGGVCFVWGMLPGPSRAAVWKWLGLFGIAMAAVLAIAAFIPAVGITMDVVLTDGPKLMAERLLLLDVLALVGLAFHRRLLAVITSFTQRLTLRMRYAQIGGSHMAGDSQLGAAIAMSSAGAGGALVGGGSLRGRGATGLGTGGLLKGVFGGFTDGTGMPGDPGRLLADANAEASRGLAPIGAAVATAGLAASGAYSLLVGKHPGDDKLSALRKPVADGDDPNAAHTQGGPGGTGGPGGSGGRIGPNAPAGGSPERGRNEDGEIVDPQTGEVLHDQKSDRTLLATRAHNRLVRLRGYRIAHQGGRMLYGASAGLPRTVHGARAGTSKATHDARQQLRVWSSSWREDGRAWGSMLQSAVQPGPSSRRIPTAAAGQRPTGASPAARTGGSGPGGGAWPQPGSATAQLSWQRSVGPRNPGFVTAPPRAERPSPEAVSGAEAPTPRPDGRRVAPVRPRPKPSSPAGASSSAKEQAAEMFRRITKNSAPRREEGDGDQS
ncbi:hypothetical protein ACTWJ8_40055 (plasmid) [Streptomyces sp. SDT5-1]|uniref:hypothetical protein n=1 Tax=Streptomyces sp. SDT5-1 TaxID=3406418 RepID=UPI003FCFF8F0